MKKTKLPSFLISLFSILLLPLSCQSQLDSKASEASGDLSKYASKIDSLVNGFAEFGEFNGALLVAKEGEVVYQKGHGYANMEWQIPNHPTTRFRIGSVTKQFTAMLIVQLAAQGQLNLQQTVSSYLPEYPKENGERITLHHLLTHSSGIPNNHGPSKPRKDIPGMTIPDNYAAQDLVDAFSALPLEFTPGAKFSYCNAGYSLLGLIIERVTGKAYEAALKERIFDPLGMKNTGFDKHRNLIENRAAGYFRSWGSWYNANYVDISSVYAAGGLYSTVEDLNLWDQALYTEEIVPKTYMDLVFTAHLPDKGYGGHYGYGWSIIDKSIGSSGETVTTIMHDGVIDGFCAIITRIPSSRSSVILLSNVRRAPLNTMTKAIMGILYDQPYDFPKRSVAYSTLELINTDGLSQAKAHFEMVKNDDTYFVEENEINAVSYQLLLSDNAPAAAEILKLGIEVFSKAFNLYDSYGEVLRKLGQQDESIKNYKKSLELNPSNENAKRVLKEMGVEGY